LGAGLPQGLLNPAMATGAATGPADGGGLAGGLGSGGGHAGAASAANGPTPIPPALRTTTTNPTGFFAQSGNDSGLRNLPTREPAIPNSGFFNKADRDPGEPNSGIRVPEDLLDD